MDMRLLLTSLILMVHLPVSAIAVDSVFDYFGKNTPDTTPVIFDFSTVVTKEFKVGNPTFSPDGKAFYFTDENSRNIFVMHKQKGSWGKPVKASFSDIAYNYEPFITKDNQQLFFVSTRTPGSGKYNGRIWQTNRKPDGKWSEPKLVIDKKTEQGFWFPTSPANGVLYFGATLEDSFGEGDFYRAEQQAGNWVIKEHLAKPINDKDYEWDPLVSPDGSYMIFQSKRAGGYGGTDIYVSFIENGKLQQPINLGREINTPEFETAAKITPDGKYMFYTLVPDGGSPQIYWVSTKVITRLKR